jgi:hypothetical protein
MFGHKGQLIQYYNYLNKQEDFFKRIQNLHFLLQ